MNDMLKNAAARAGINYADAEALIRELRNPTYAMCEDGDTAAVPPFVWTEQDYGTFRKHFQEWEGLTPGEYAFAKVCAVWRKVCDGLLSEDTEYHSQSDFLPYPHPAEKKDITD